MPKKQHLLDQFDVYLLMQTKNMQLFFSDCEKLQKISQKTPILKTTNQHHITHAVSKQLLMALKNNIKASKLTKHHTNN